MVIGGQYHLYDYLLLRTEIPLLLPTLILLLLRLIALPRLRQYAKTPFRESEEYLREAYIIE